MCMGQNFYLDEYTIFKIHVKTTRNSHQTGRCFQILHGRKVHEGQAAERCPQPDRLSSWTEKEDNKHPL